MSSERKFEKFEGEVKLSQAVNINTIKRFLDAGSAIRYIVMGNGDIILGTTNHDGIVAENGLDVKDVQFGNHFKRLNTGALLGKLKWGLDRTFSVEEKIEAFLKTNGIDF